MSDLDKEIIEQLKLTNKLLAQILIKDSSSQTERVTILKNSGFSASDIADLLGIKLNVVTATLSSVKKSKTKKSTK